MKNVARFLKQDNIVPDEKLNLLTPLSSLLKSGDQVNSFKKMLSDNYQIYPKKLDEKFSTVGNMCDLIGFVAQNGRNFKFN
jgi:hypothetical protein